MAGERSRLGWIDELMSAKRKLDAAKQTGNGVASSKERIRNIMASHVDEIVNAVAGISEVETMKERLANMQRTLDEADDEYNALNKEHKETKVKLEKLQAMYEEAMRKDKVGKAGKPKHGSGGLQEKTINAEGGDGLQDKDADTKGGSGL